MLNLSSKTASTEYDQASTLDFKELGYILWGRRQEKLYFDIMIYV